jgi:hypothetical protein
MNVRSLIMSLQDRKTVERTPDQTASLTFCGSGGPSIQPQDEPDSHFLFRAAEVIADCRKVLVAGPSTLWLHRNTSYYVLTNDLTREAFLVIGTRAGQLEADLRRLGHDPRRIATARTVEGSDDVSLKACLARYVWMGPVETQVLLSFKTRRG